MSEPKRSSISFSATVVLFAMVGTQVLTLNGNDSKEISVSSRVAFPPYFMVDSQSGNVTLCDTLDREISGETELMVTIPDGLNTVNEKVRAFVSEANDEPPAFLKTAYSIHVPENIPPGTSIFQVRALDRDTISGGGITYTLQPNGQQSQFTVGEHNGVVHLKADSALDAEEEKMISLKITAQDGGGVLDGNFEIFSISILVTINVEDVQDTPPIFVGVPYQARVYENAPAGVEIFTVLAFDGDQENLNPIMYAIVQGSEGSFVINETDGVIRIEDVNKLHKSTYNLTIEAMEVGPHATGPNASRAVVIVSVLDVNNHLPTFCGVQGPQQVFHVNIQEHPPEGEVLQPLNLTVCDHDKGSEAKFHLRILGSEGTFQVVPTVILNQAPISIVVKNGSFIDHERRRVIKFQILAEQMETMELRTSVADIVVNIIDINDNVPVFSRDHYVARVRENSPGSSSIISILATDPDSGDFGEISYSLYGEDSTSFLIHPSKGSLFTQPWTKLDAEISPEYHFFIRAMDGGGLFSVAKVLIIVTTMKDHPTTFPGRVLRNVMTKGVPFHIEAKDEEMSWPNNVVQQSLVKVEPLNVFELNNFTGKLHLQPQVCNPKTLQNFVHNQRCNWTQLVRAHDCGLLAFTCTMLITFKVIDKTSQERSEADFMKNVHNNPMRTLGVMGALLVFLILLALLISSLTFCRNKCSKRVAPVRLIILMRPKDRTPRYIRCLQRVLGKPLNTRRACNRFEHLPSRLHRNNSRVPLPDHDTIHNICGLPGPPPQIPPPAPPPLPPAQLTTITPILPKRHNFHAGEIEYNITSASRQVQEKERFDGADHKTSAVITELKEHFKNLKQKGNL